MRNLADFVLRGRQHAILLALLFSLIPLMGWVADVILALVTLRKGAKEGALVLMWIILPNLVMAIKGYPLLWFYNVLGDSVMVYTFAMILRMTASWTITIEAAMLIGIISLAAFHIFVPDIDLYWQKEWMTYVNNAAKQLEIQDVLAAANINSWVKTMSKIATGMQIVYLFMSDIIYLMIARWWQANLFNPQGLRPELLNIRLDRVAIIILVLVVLFSLTGNEFAIDGLAVVIAPFVAAGISLVHSFADMAAQKQVWLISFYGIVILIALLFPYALVLLAALALADSFLNFRQRLQTK